VHGHNVNEDGCCHDGDGGEDHGHDSAVVQAQRKLAHYRSLFIHL
jgi:hypothetical protein